VCLKQELLLKSKVQISEIYVNSIPNWSNWLFILWTYINFTFVLCIFKKSKYTESGASDIGTYMNTSQNVNGKKFMSLISCMWMTGLSECLWKWCVYQNVNGNDVYIRMSMVMMCISECLCKWCGYQNVNVNDVDIRMSMVMMCISECLW